LLGLLDLYCWGIGGGGGEFLLVKLSMFESDFVDQSDFNNNNLSHRKWKKSKIL
jgi:hypothetical protein